MSNLQVMVDLFVVVAYMVPKFCFIVLDMVLGNFL